MRRIRCVLLVTSSVSAAVLLSGPSAAEPGISSERPVVENGDVNGDGVRNVSDGVYLLSHLFAGGPAPEPISCSGEGEAARRNGDADGDGTIRLSDAIDLIGWLLAGGPAPVPACGLNVGAGGNPPASRVVCVLGLAEVQGEETVVDLLVVVPPGAKAKEVIRDALSQQGASLFDSANLGSAGFRLSGFQWDTVPAVQNYNPSDEPIPGVTVSAWGNTHATWNAVATAQSVFAPGGSTDRCPSLVKECPGQQFFDGFNDMGWRRLGRNVLGVAWFGTSTDEVDIALSTAFDWNDGCTDDPAGTFSVETVLLHENGHFCGLGHYDEGSIMEAIYDTAQCFLGEADEEGVTYLYPMATGSVSGLVTDPAAAPIAGAVVSLPGTSLSATTEVDGFYEIPAVPVPVTYDVRASAEGFETETIRLLATGDTTVDFSLDMAVPPPPCAEKGDPCETNGDCCSNNCKGRPGFETCK